LIILGTEKNTAPKILESKKMKIPILKLFKNFFIKNCDI
jgi:hypothetical protein